MIVVCTCSAKCKDCLCGSNFMVQWSPTCFGLSCGHLQGGEIKNKNINKMCLNESTVGKSYSILLKSYSILLKSYSILLKSYSILLKFTVE